MNTFVWFCVFLFFAGAFIWNKTDALNLLIKAGLFLLAIWGLLLSVGAIK